MATLSASPVTEVRVPDIGDFKDIPVVDVLVKVGSTISVDDPIVTLESDKATLDVPASSAGRVTSVEVSPGSRVSCGSLLLKIEPLLAVAAKVATIPSKIEIPREPAASVAAPHFIATGAPSSHAVARQARRSAYAGPAVRRFARELAVDLNELTGSGPRGRILREDVMRRVKGHMLAGSPAESGPVSPRPAVDFSKFGEIERTPLKRVSRISAQVLTKNWSTIPHVTNFEDADITDLDEFRKDANGQSRAETKLTLTAFVVKACAAALLQVPALNVSLDGTDLIVKKYVHIGVAVDAKEGLMVPVIRNVDMLGVGAIAAQLGEKAQQARAGQLKADDMQGGSLTISSLGNTGGRHFTPIINAPEVAIVGLGKSRIEPRWNGKEFIPRQILPLSLSWDHRALDGVTAARFLMQLVAFLEDFRRVTL